MVRDAVEREDVRVVVIDSLTGYQNAMPGEQYLMLQMHEMLTYLNQQGVTTLLVLAQHGLVGQMSSTVDLTYLSDTVMLFRFFEADGACAGRCRWSRRGWGRTRTPSGNFGSTATVCGSASRWRVPGRPDGRAELPRRAGPPAGRERDFPWGSAGPGQR